MIDVEAMKELARKIPSQGGHGIKEQLQSYSSLIPIRTGIVEVGVWKDIKGYEGLYSISNYGGEIFEGKSVNYL